MQYCVAFAHGILALGELHTRANAKSSCDRPGEPAAYADLRFVWPALGSRCDPRGRRTTRFFHLRGIDPSLGGHTPSAFYRDAENMRCPPRYEERLHSRNSAREKWPAKFWRLDIASPGGKRAPQLPSGLWREGVATQERRALWPCC